MNKKRFPIPTSYAEHEALSEPAKRYYEARSNKRFAIGLAGLALIGGGVKVATMHGNDSIVDGLVVGAIGGFIGAEGTRALKEGLRERRALAEAHNVVSPSDIHIGSANTISIPPPDEIPGPKA